MTNIQAALGVAQLERLDEFLVRKRCIGKLYSERLKSLERLQLPLDRTDYAENHYWVFGVVLDDSFEFDAPEAMRRLNQRGIGCRPFFCPMQMQPVLRKMGLFDGDQYPVSERLYRRGFYIPSGLALTETQVDDVSRVMKELFS